MKKIYYGEETQKALNNFNVSSYNLSQIFIISFCEVKEAAAITNMELGFLDETIGNAIISVCSEIKKGELSEQIVVDPFQGGAGTSTNMNFNEVIANRASEITGKKVSALSHVNMHQSTNDVYLTAVIITIIKYLNMLEKEIAKLQDAFQKKEQEFATVTKIGRTQLQDAVPMTLGMEFGAYAEAFSRDRWRIFKARERIKQVNLGGTAIGTGVGAPRDYIFKVTSNLKKITGLKIARAENLIDATQNYDRLTEVFGFIKSFALNLIKISNDLRFLSSGPDCGIGEIILPKVQRGSTIMPGKVNPVILEMVIQVALRVVSNESLVSNAVAMGNLEINQFAPIISFSFFESFELLINATKLFTDKVVLGIEANSNKNSENIVKSRSIAALFLPYLGYKKIEKIVEEATEKNRGIIDIILERKLLDKERVEEIMKASSMYKLGF